MPAAGLGAAGGSAGAGAGSGATALGGAASVSTGAGPEAVGAAAMDSATEAPDEGSATGTTGGGASATVAFLARISAALALASATRGSEPLAISSSNTFCRTRRPAAARCSKYSASDIPAGLGSVSTGAAPAVSTGAGLAAGGAVGGAVGASAAGGGAAGAGAAALSSGPLAPSSSGLGGSTVLIQSSRRSISWVRWVMSPSAYSNSGLQNRAS